MTAILTAGIVLAVASLVKASPPTGPDLQAGAPTVVSYQGSVVVDDSPYEGTGYFKFAVVNAAGDTTYWSNDGTSTGGGEPTTAVPLDVSEGLFDVLLGDTDLSGMSAPLTSAAFEGSGHAVDWWVVAGGGASATGEGGHVTLHDTLGQPIVDTSSGDGGQVTLSAGYWAGNVPLHRIYLPLMLRQWASS